MTADSPALTGWDLLRMDPDYIGSCPCASFALEGTRIEVHCWRVCFECTYCGVHYEGDKAVAARVKKLMAALDWCSTWPIRTGLRLDPRP